MADNRMASGTEIVFKKLKAAAAEPRLVTYGELADAAGLQPRIIGRRLDDINTRLCQQMPGLPWLVAIAVSKTTGVPSEGLLARRGKNIELNLKDPNVVLHVFATAQFWGRFGALSCSATVRLVEYRLHVAHRLLLAHPVRLFRCEPPHSAH